jgi:hypothetical protein
MTQEQDSIPKPPNPWMEWLGKGSATQLLMEYPVTGALQFVILGHQKIGGLVVLVVTDIERIVAPHFIDGPYPMDIPIETLTDHGPILAVVILRCDNAIRCGIILYSQRFHINLLTSIHKKGWQWIQDR